MHEAAALDDRGPLLSSEMFATTLPAAPARWTLRMFGHPALALMGQRQAGPTSSSETSARNLHTRRHQPG